MTTLMTKMKCGKPCLDSKVFISIHSFYGALEVIDCSCLACGWHDHDLEGRFFTMEGRFLKPKFFPPLTLKKLRKKGREFNENDND